MISPAPASPLNIVERGRRLSVSPTPSSVDIPRDARMHRAVGFRFIGARSRGAEYRDITSSSQGLARVSGAGIFLLGS